MSLYSKFEFYQGEDKTLTMQVNVQDRSTDSKAPIDLTNATLVEVEIPAMPANLILNNTSTMPLVLVDQPTLGKIHVDLTAIETAQMVDGSIVVRVTISGKRSIAVASAGCRKLVVPNC